MLLIGDIHINSRHAETLIHMLRNYATAHDDRQILLLGDVVYHFSYQRGALLQLFELFVERYQQDKQVIVLAGNHDWIQDAYVYAEAQKAFAVIQKKDLTEGASGIFFVTHPQLVDLEGHKALLLPHTLDHTNLTLSSTQTKQVQQAFPIIYADCQSLLSSNTPKEQHSAHLTLYVLFHLIQQNGLWLYHHHYIAQTIFPGQQARFSYKDLALHPGLLQIQGLRMISGHLHQPFSFYNYCCIGSIWHTSPTEKDHYKALRKQDEQTIIGEIIHHNPYISLSGHDTIDEHVLSTRLQEIMDKTIASIHHSSQRNILLDNTTLPTLDHCCWSIQAERNTILHDIMSEKLQHQCKQVRIQSKKEVTDVIEQLQLEGKHLGTSLQDWKLLLQEYLTKKHPDRHEEYEALLREMKIR